MFSLPQKVKNPNYTTTATAQLSTTQAAQLPGGKHQRSQHKPDTDKALSQQKMRKGIRKFGLTASTKEASHFKLSKIYKIKF